MSVLFDIHWNVSDGRDLWRGSYNLIGLSIKTLPDDYRHWPGASDMDINPYIGNKTHFINSLLGGAPLGPRSGFVFTVLGSFKTDNIGLGQKWTRSLFVQKIVNDVKDRISGIRGDKKLAGSAKINEKNIQTTGLLLLIHQVYNLAGKAEQKCPKNRGLGIARAAFNE